MQATLIFTLVIASIINIIRGHKLEEIWVTYLALGIGLLIPSPKVKNTLEKNEEPLVSSEAKGNGFMQNLHKRTSQSRELFYVQSVMITIIIITSIVNLSIGTSSSQVWVAILSASYGNILPSPTFSKKKNVTNI